MHLARDPRGCVLDLWQLDQAGPPPEAGILRRGARLWGCLRPNGGSGPFIWTRTADEGLGRVRSFRVANF